MKTLIITLLIFTGFLKERDINQDYKTYSYTKKTKDYTESRPICPVPVERDSYVEDVESSNTLFVQEEIKPVPLLIPMDLRCDGLRCLIPPIEGQLTNPGLELSSAIIQDFLPIVPYIETLISDTENGTSVEGILLGFLLPEVFAYLLNFYYGRWSSRKKAEKDRAEAPAESEDPQSPAQTQDNVEEKAELSSRECKQREEPRSAKKKNKKQHPSEAHEHQVPQKPKSNETTKEDDEKELKRLFHQFLCQCLEGNI